MHTNTHIMHFNVLSAACLAALDVFDTKVDQLVAKAISDNFWRGGVVVRPVPTLENSSDLEITWVLDRSDALVDRLKSRGYRVVREEPEIEGDLGWQMVITWDLPDSLPETKWHSKSFRRSCLKVVNLTNR